jgi:protein-disulfide isomerase
LPQIENEYIKTGKVKYVVLDFPLESIHKHAFKAAEAARCAGDQDKFWEMHNRLFANQQAVAPNNLTQYAQALGLDMPNFQQCLDGGKYAPDIRKNLAEGQKAGVTGTPRFFLGMTNPNDSKIKALGTLKGAQPYASFKEIIDNLLSSPK